MMDEAKKFTKYWVPPESYDSVSDPVETRIQLLPLKELSWDSFQGLCARLAQRCGNVEKCQEYGLPGQKQEGIDIYIRKSDSSKYSVWQCKRYKEIKPSSIEKAVSDFLNGSWVSKTDEFVFTVSTKIEEINLAKKIEEQNKLLNKQGIQFFVLGITQISERLKDHPDLVDDFFGRVWVRKFCGEDIASQLSNRRLQPTQIIELRKLLRNCYEEHFEVTDPGLPSLIGSIISRQQSLSLVDRFVPPEILIKQQVSHTSEILSEQQVSDSRMFYHLPWEPEKRLSRFDANEENPPPQKTQFMLRSSEVRRSAIDWISDSEQSVIIGDPGIGKTTLLRCVLLDLLSTEPRYETCARRWGQYLPIWVPFAMWTRLVKESERNCSLSDVLTAWLNKVSAGKDLIELVQQALEDSRLLLFVDGLDEWNDETAARTALTLLDQFVGERNVPAIASSRPLGYARLGGLTNKWRTAELAGLTREQQHTLAERWFLHRLNVSHPHGSNGDSIDRKQTRAKAEADQHIQDIHRDVCLSRLAETPLLLNGLIALAIQQIHLPRSRFKAYEELTRLLLEEQPKRREKAVYARGDSRKLSQENRVRALAWLAWKIHNSSGSDVLEKTAAKKVFEKFCRNHLHKSPAEALEIAEELLDIGANVVGILVEKSSVEIGFIHRSFQEFLSAKYLSYLRIKQQKRAVRKLFKNPRWHDVFLCLCHLNTREGEVDDFIEIIKNIELEKEMELARYIFLAKIAFSDLHCSQSVARKLAKETFNIIEVGVQDRIREQLIKITLDGLQSDALRSFVESRIQRWYPLRHRHRDNVYRVVAKWPKDKKLEAFLWRGLLDENQWNQRAAAESLAKVFSDDPAVKQRLFEILLKPAEPRLLAHALHALCLGWSTDDRLSGILKDARLSVDSTLQSVALIHRVKREEHDLQDRQILMDMSRDWIMHSGNWREDRSRALIAGWPGDPEIKKEAIISVTGSYHSRGVFYGDDAGIILIEGYSQDDEVTSVIAHLFETEQFPGNALGVHSDWRGFVDSFAGNNNLIPSIDKWIAQNIDRQPFQFELCLILPRERAKEYLLKPDKATGCINHHQAWLLLREWGIRDKEVQNALIQFADTESAVLAADFLPDIMNDHDLCRQRLLDVLRNESGFTAIRALQGLMKIEAIDDIQDEVIDIAIKMFTNNNSFNWSYLGMYDFMRRFNKHPRVRGLALYQLQNRWGHLSAVADIYASDDEIRQKIIMRCSPLPENLRLIIVNRLTRLAPEDHFAHDMLLDYDKDVDTNIKTSGAIGYAKSVKQRDKISSDLLNELKNDLCVAGLDMNERRQAAFACLLELDQLNIVKSLWSENDRDARFDCGSIYTNIRLATHLAEHWNRIQREFSSNFWKKFRSVGDDFLSEMGIHIADPDLFRKIIDEYQQSGNRQVSNLLSLQVRARCWHGTPRLRDLCLEYISHSYLPKPNLIHTIPYIVAAEILADQFTNDDLVYSQLESFANKDSISSALVISLSAGWRESRAWKELSSRVDISKLLTPAQFYLAAASYPPDEFIVQLSELISYVTGNTWEVIPSCLRAVTARFACDKDVRDLAFQHLHANPTSVQKINFPSFLVKTDEHPERLRTWIQSEIDHQSDDAHLAEIAFDLFTGTTRSVGHVLLEHLMV